MQEKVCVEHGDVASGGGALLPSAEVVSDSEERRFLRLDLAFDERNATRCRIARFANRPVEAGVELCGHVPLVGEVAQLPFCKLDPLQVAVLAPPEDFPERATCPALSGQVAKLDPKCVEDLERLLGAGAGLQPERHARLR